MADEQHRDEDRHRGEDRSYGEDGSRGDGVREPARGVERARSGEREVSRREVPAGAARFVTAAWPALWIAMFAIGWWQLALVLLFLTGPVLGALHASGRPRRRRERELRRAQRRAWYDERVLGHSGSGHGGSAFGGSVRGGSVFGGSVSGGSVQGGSAASHQVPSPAPRTPRGPTASAAERALAAAVVRAETSGGRLDPPSLELVREVDALLRPLLAHVRARGADAGVRHDLETLASEHLPSTLDAYLVLPVDYAHEHRTATGTTPADELRSQLTLLVEGCRQLRDAVHDADATRQAELGRFLDAKFRRSDLDL